MKNARQLQDSTRRARLLIPQSVLINLLLRNAHQERVLPEEPAGVPVAMPT
jgi:hypothetical protein